MSFAPILPKLTGARTIMPLGDSLTRGYLASGSVDGGWRVPLQSKITAAGYSWTQIGPYSDNGLNHGGLNGRSTATLNGNIATLLGSGFYEPDVIVLMTGTNDAIDAGYNGAAYAFYLDNILVQINALLPSTRVVVASSLPTLSGAFASYAPNIVDINSRIPGTVKATTVYTAGRMHLVNIASVVRPDDVATDGAHPDADAYQRMADAYWPAVKAAMGF